MKKSILDQIVSYEIKRNQLIVEKEKICQEVYLEIVPKLSGLRISEAKTIISKELDKNVKVKEIKIKLLAMFREYLDNVEL